MVTFSLIAIVLLVMNLMLVWMAVGMASTALALGGTIDELHVGIGAVVFRVRHLGTTYYIHLIPFGVTLGIKGLFGSRHRLFALSGALWCLITAFGLSCAQAGVLGDGRLFRAPQVGYVQPDSAAARSGVMAGDRLIAIDGELVSKWREAVASMKARLEPGSVRIRLARAESEQDRTVAFDRFENQVLGEFFVFGLYPHVDAVVREMAQDGPAWKSGIRPGDRIVGIAGREIGHFVEAYLELNGTADNLLDVEVERQSERMHVRLDRTHDGKVLRLAGMNFYVIEREGSVQLTFRHWLSEGPQIFVDKVSVVWMAVRNRRLKQDLRAFAGSIALLGTVTDRVELLTVFCLLWGVLNLSPLPPCASAQAWWGHRGRWPDAGWAKPLSLVVFALLVFVPF